MTDRMPAVSQRSDRIASIDFWRGLYLLMIYANHVPGNFFSYLTLRNWGFADSAEPFIFISGFSAMLAFGRFYDRGGFITGLCRTLKRTWQLFGAHILLVFAMSAIIAMAGDATDGKPIMEEMNFSPFFVETNVAVVRLLNLRYMPHMTDILPLYIALIFVFPLIWALIRVSSILALAVSAFIWVWANATGVSLANYPEGTTWFFNPIAWQLLFVAGMVAFKERARIPHLIHSRLLFALSSSIVLFGLLAAAPWAHFEAFSSWRVVPSSWLSYDVKANLSWPRVLHFFALAFLAARLFPPTSSLWQKGWVQTISLCGRHSLPIFCGGTVLSLIVHVALRLGRLDGMASAFITFAGFLVLISFAWVLDRAKKRLQAVSSERRRPPCEPEETVGVIETLFPSTTPELPLQKTA
ncbi:MAG: OpgC family protein [Bdellovibrionales bacterium]